MQIKKLISSKSLTWFSILSFTILNFSVKLWAKEELQVIHEISSSKKSIVINRGAIHGIAEGQEFIVSNDFTSILAIASEVNRDQSLWVPADENGYFPFDKNEIISMTSHSYGSVSLNFAGGKENLLVETITEPYHPFQLINYWHFKIGTGTAINQSVSSVDPSNNPQKLSFDYAVMYGIKNGPHHEFLVGLRYDFDQAKLKNIELKLETTRMFVTAGYSYQFINSEREQNHPYIGINFGIGKSTTKNGGENGSGIATLLPEIFIGKYFKIDPKLAINLELKIESINSIEKYSDSNKQQSHLTNLKANLGFTF